jgi:hypothetical protein
MIKQSSPLSSLVVGFSTYLILIIHHAPAEAIIISSYFLLHNITSKQERSKPKEHMADGSKKARGATSNEAP